MNKLLLLCAAFGWSVAAFGQGAIYFANTATTLFTTNYAGSSGPMSGANAFRIGLYTAPDGTLTESLFTLIAVATNSSSPLALGRFAHPEVPYIIQGNNGTPIAFQIRAWSLFAGNSYEQAIFSFGGIVGKSPIGRVTPATGVAAPPSLFGPGDYPGQLTSGVVIGIPEPGTLALGMLGALLMFCCLQKRKAR